MAARTGGASQSRGKEKPATSQLMEAGGLEERMLTAFWGPPHAGYTPHGCVSHSFGTQGGRGTHFSMAETCFVSNFPLVRSSGVILPSKSSPSLAIFTRMSLTSSPMYSPLTIFSNLQERAAAVTQGSTGSTKRQSPAVRLPQHR